MKQALIILGALCGLLVLTCVGGVVYVWTSAGPPPGITVTIEQPDPIVVGDRFDLVVTVANDLDRERTVKDIDFWSPLLDGAVIRSVDPPPAAETASLGLSTYTMNRPIPPRGETSIAFEMKARRTGAFTGDLDVAVDGFLRINTTVHTIVVERVETPSP